MTTVPSGEREVGRRTFMSYPPLNPWEEKKNLRALKRLKYIRKKKIHHCVKIFHNVPVFHSSSS